MLDNTQPTLVPTIALTINIPTATLPLPTQTSTQTPVVPTPTPTATPTPSYPIQGRGPTGFPSDVDPLTGLQVDNPLLLD
ncbi:MAG: hypothetical protein IH586_08240, partial [Anaerolineaceae bacterium]|nr:hypothetical protein [Anaerolineaceae bacterium]